MVSGKVDKQLKHVAKATDVLQKLDTGLKDGAQ